MKKLFIKDTLIEDAIIKLQEFESLKKDLDKKLILAPEGKLRVIKRNKSFQYYLVTKNTKRWGIYLSKRNNKAFIKKLAQKVYTQNLTEELTKQCNVLKQFINSYNPCAIPETFSSLSTGFKEIVTPIFQDESDFISEWKSVEYARKTIPETAKQYTNSGTIVRSKSEVLIAETLDKNNIPYRYEYPIELKPFGIVHPDFLCLDIKTGKEIIWEHFGMMDDSEYAEIAVKKINLYQQNGFILGKNLCITMETSNTPLTLREINMAKASVNL